MVAARAGGRRSAWLAVVLCAVMGASACSASPAVRNAFNSGAGQSALQSTYVRVIRHVLPSVVQIVAGDSTGSGVVFDSKGDIVTNAHVVGSKKTFEVSTASVSKDLPAKLVGVFIPDDLAVIRVTSGADELRPVRWADSSKAQVGEIVLAMGSPYGLIDSVTQGIVSATGRTVTSGPAEGGKPPPVITGAIQTSAAINPGNSGGALVTLGAEVIGINTLAARDPELGNAAPGIGFAIPANTARDIATQLIDTGKVTRSDRASLDITGRTSTDSSGSPNGVIVAELAKGGSAATAGLKTGDIITSLDGRATPSVAELENVLTEFRPGDKVTLRYLRNGKSHEATAELGTLGS